MLPFPAKKSGETIPRWMASNADWRRLSEIKQPVRSCRSTAQQCVAGQLGGGRLVTSDQGRNHMLAAAFGQLSSQDVEDMGGLVEKIRTRLDDEAARVALPRCNDSAIENRRFCRRFGP